MVTPKTLCEKKNEYEEKISKHKEINTTSIQILEGIENVL